MQLKFTFSFINYNDYTRPAPIFIEVLVANFYDLFMEKQEVLNVRVTEKIFLVITVA